ncbi:DUF47 domain-containing protein [Marinobacter persicus]|uniref:Phosphate transport regulator n=1 Tax=Marinobacter persicus TaxID=930118 RepID=A0A2S6G343_9GAMM|nr:DUF47 family protein [Marinobacter persicus]PPK50261.1 hypothetical protein BY455_13033 [Marinobacter persicus]PPK52886.1 hypothetical protein B0H24_103133 [Marinobacter persicus]PPK56749.1 hypothetical protein BY454_13333 [Marinobacter persicus]
MARKESVLSRLVAKVIPKSPDFFSLLAEQSRQVRGTMASLHEYMNGPTEALSDELTDDEHAADTLKIRNLHLLNRAFSTPIDREDIYRAIEALDWIVTHSKSTINEMLDFGVDPDKHMQAMLDELLHGCEALQRGFSELATHPAGAENEAHAARHAHRRIERLYRHSLAELFQGEVTVEMLKKREIYHHLMDSSRRLHSAANVLHDIFVKLV